MLRRGRRRRRLVGGGGQNSRCSALGQDQCYHLSNRTKIDQNRTKSGPLFSANPDQYHEIRLLSDFLVNSRSFQFCNTSTSSLNSWWKSVNSSIFGQIRTFFMQIRTISGPISRKKSRSGQKSGKMDQMGALQMVSSATVEWVKQGQVWRQFLKWTSLKFWPCEVIYFGLEGWQK